MVWDGIKTICLDFDGVLHMYTSGFDRALTFRGVFPTPQELQDFKPWNKP